MQTFVCNLQNVMLGVNIWIVLKGLVKNSGSCRWLMGVLRKLYNQLCNSNWQISLWETYSRQLKKRYTAFCETHRLISLFSRAREHFAINQVDITKTYILKIDFNVILPYTLKVSKLSLPLGATHQNVLWTFQVLCIYYVLHPSSAEGHNSNCEELLT
jgi:hypothetical protein